MVAVFGDDREAVIARELTKTFETIRGGTLGELLEWLEADRNHRRGEFVILLHGAAEPDRMEPDARDLQVLKVLLRELPLKQAAGLAAKITGVPKNRLYEKGVALKRDDP